MTGWPGVCGGMTLSVRLAIIVFVCFAELMKDELKQG